MNDPLVLAGSVVVVASFMTVWCSRQAVRLLITFSRDDEVNTSFTDVEAGMVELEAGMESMSFELTNVMEANKEIVSSISTLSVASEEVLAETQVSKETINGTFDSMKVFTETVDGTFEQLQILKETAVTE